MEHKKVAEEIYESMYSVTPDTLAWGTRHNIALAASKKLVHKICTVLPSYPCDETDIQSHRGEIDCAIKNWKKVKDQLDNI
jgi:hypothetical protein